MNTRNGVTFQLNWRVFFHSQFAITRTCTHLLSPFLILCLRLSLSLSHTHTHTQACELHNDMVSHQIHLKLWNPIHWGGGEDSWPFLSLSLSWSRGQLLLLLPQPTSFHSKTKTIQNKMIQKLFFSKQENKRECFVLFVTTTMRAIRFKRNTHKNIFLNKVSFFSGFLKKSTCYEKKGCWISD